MTIDLKKIRSFEPPKFFGKQQRKKVIDALLTPLSWIYGAAVWVRNFAFDAGLLKQHRFKVPVVSVGNIAAGGTGKTPHVEYIISALCQSYNIGVLSRGYKRATHGFILASDNMTPHDLGDEPYQIYHKFNGLITLAVCESRVKGIHEMLRINPSINLFILDDAFQHRYVVPKVNIVLVDYNRPPYTDHLLPLGTLREPASRLLKADFVVVTKCPSDIKPVNIRMTKENLDLFPSQELFFSNVKYANPAPVFPVQPQLSSLSSLQQDDAVLCVTGIANAMPFVKYIRQFIGNIKVFHFADHHYFTRKDFNDIFFVFNKMQGRRKFVLTTEKDAVRILNNPYFPPTMRSTIYFVPIKVGFLEYDNRDFITELKKKIDEKKQ